MPYEDLTVVQEEALAFIRQYIDRNKKPPLQSEIASALNVTGSAASRYIFALAEAGYIKRRPGRRGIILVTPTI